MPSTSATTNQRQNATAAYTVKVSSFRFAINRKNEIELGMKYCLVLATGVASLNFLGASYAGASESSSPDTGLTLPSQPAGDSLSTFLYRLFSDETEDFPQSTNLAGSNEKRSLNLVNATTSPYTNSYGLHQSSWDEETDSGTISYNISADFSNCSTGLRLGTDIGVYTFTNGTTTNATDLRDMVADLYTLRHSRQSPNPNYANHTAAVARLALNEANQLLNSGLICPNASTTTTTDLILHQELRHLLTNKHSYWTAVILSAAGGAAVGGSVAAVTDVIFNGNVTAQNVVQTAIVIGAVVIIGGILTRLDQVGHLDRAEDIAHRVTDIVPQSREAVVQNAYVGWARRMMQRIVRQQVEEALSEHGIGSAAGSVVTSPGGGSVTPGSVQSLPGSGVTSPGGGSVTPGSVQSMPEAGTPDSTAFGRCLSEMEAAQAGSAIGEMSDVTLDLETIQEVMEQLGPRDAQGSCRTP